MDKNSYTKPSYYNYSAPYSLCLWCILAILINSYFNGHGVLLKSALLSYLSLTETEYLYFAVNELTQCEIKWPVHGLTGVGSWGLIRPVFLLFPVPQRLPVALRWHFPPTAPGCPSFQSSSSQEIFHLNLLRPSHILRQGISFSFELLYLWNNFYNHCIGI